MLDAGHHHPHLCPSLSLRAQLNCRLHKCTCMQKVKHMLRKTLPSVQAVPRTIFDRENAKRRSDDEQ